MLSRAVVSDSIHFFNSILYLMDCNFSDGSKMVKLPDIFGPHISEADSCMASQMKMETLLETT